MLRKLQSNSALTVRTAGVFFTLLLLKSGIKKAFHDHRYTTRRGVGCCACEIQLGDKIWELILDLMQQWVWRGPNSEGCGRLAKMY